MMMIDDMFIAAQDTACRHRQTGYRSAYVSVVK
jgi:hypothetical protein